ncbi:MAG: T9SS type A sorting domain-containing protein [Ignavibacteriae bacterium]|nr:T9SS type A sorting domain-containing protein [Ignavibacteriota bacterium]
MAYVYLVEENEVSNTPTTVVYDEFRVRSRFSLDVREVGGETPAEFRLEQNYPNPFNPSTNFRFRIANFSSEGGSASGGGLVTLKVFDVLGREVVNVVNKELPAGNYSVTFDAGELTSGVYYYQLQAGSFIETKKFLLMR